MPVTSKPQPFFCSQVLGWAGLWRSPRSRARHGAGLSGQKGSVGQVGGHLPRSSWEGVEEQVAGAGSCGGVCRDQASPGLQGPCCAPDWDQKAWAGTHGHSPSILLEAEVTAQILSGWKDVALGSQGPEPGN